MQSRDEHGAGNSDGTRATNTGALGRGDPPAGGAGGTVDDTAAPGRVVAGVERAHVVHEMLETPPRLGLGQDVGCSGREGRGKEEGGQESHRAHPSPQPSPARHS